MYMQVNTIKFKSFCTAKDTINKTKTIAAEWDKISAKVTDKWLISKIYKQLIEFDIKQWPNQKIRRRSKKTVFKKKIIIRHRDCEKPHVKMLNMGLQIGTH